MNGFLRLLLLALLVPLEAGAARVDTVAVPSAKMGREITALVVLPDGAGPFPTVYLLHGHGGGAFDWQRHTDLGALADRYGLAIVCPDGAIASWYLDSPADPSSQYETFVALELPAWVEARFPVLAERRGRAITGLSMGGHGALFLALRHSGRYVAAASMSGGMELSGFRDRWSLTERIGDYETYPQRWRDLSVVGVVTSVDTTDLPALFIDCGIDDFFLETNRRLRALLLERGIPHDYIERPGGHTWDYWTRVLPYHLLFFRERFE